MTKSLFATAFGAGVLLTGARGANAQEEFGTHLGQTSATCQSALAYIASPAADRY
jgi:hypothetical protein